MTDQIQMWTPERAEYVRPSMAEVRAVERNGLTAVGSFSGCGGSSLGLKMAGWEVAAAIEFIPAAAETYRANFPETHLIERDIREVKVGELRDFLQRQRGIGYGELDLFEGSPPCASFSPAGMRERGWGTEKKYSDSKQRTDDLFWEWKRLLEGLMPRAFVAENVPGMITGEAESEYAHRITRDLGTVGYRVAAAVLNSAAFGVPQERRRLIFLGYREDQGVHPAFPSPLGGEPHTTRQAIESVDPSEPDHADFLADSSMEGKAVGRTWEWKKGLRDKNDCARCGVSLREHRPDTKEVGSVKKQKGQEGARRVKAIYRCADGQEAIEVKDYFLLTLPELDKPCPTVTATGSQTGAASVVHPTENRKFTPAEAKAICGFPADFILTGTREQRYERMGRAVTPPLYAAVGRTIAEALA